MPHSMQELISQTGVLNPCSLQWKCRVLIIGREVPNKGGFKKNFVCLFVYFWLHWVFIAKWRPSLVSVSRSCSLLGCTGFSLWWLLLLQSMGSRHKGFSSCSSQTHELGLRSCSPWAWLPYGMWNLPGTGIEPMSPALAGEFLTTGSPGKSENPFLAFSSFQRPLYSLPHAPSIFPASEGQLSLPHTASL